MTPAVRPARHEDVTGIVEWTTDTFEWGDYVPHRIAGWIEDPRSELMVCVDDSDTPIAMAHAVMLSPTEGWLEAARVHPDHRRAGLGSILNHAGVAWAKERGARIVRLATEAINDAARSQVEALGYRQTSSWIYAEIEIERDINVSRDLRMRPAPSSDVDAAWMFWSTSELALEGRSFIADGWQWRRASPQDLVDAASNGQFFQNPAGWAIADHPDDSMTRTKWLATTKEDAPRLIDGLIRLATEQESSELTIKMPEIPWTREALTRARADIGQVLVYSKPVM